MFQFWSETQSVSTLLVCDQRRPWRDCAYAHSRLSPSLIAQDVNTKSHALANLFNNPIPDTLVNDKKIIQKSLLFNQTVEPVKVLKLRFTHNRTKSLDNDLGDLYSIQIVTYNIRGILSY